MAAESCIECDVAIVGAGFAGALIANELNKDRGRPIEVVILEAGEGVPPNINDYMERFYTAKIKVPESPYTPPVVDKDDKPINPSRVNAGRPTSISLGPKGDPKAPPFGDWTDPKQSYLIQKGPRPFASTYDRVAGGTSHWLGTCLRFVPADFKMKTNYPSVPQFVDWPISYDDLNECYGKAEEELGVSADLQEQSFLGIHFPDNYKYPMPRIPRSLVDVEVDKALKSLSEDQTRFLEMEKPPTSIAVRSLPAARNSQPYKNRRACAGNTNCIPICPIQAKYDPTITLNDAVETGHVKILDRHVASEIVVGENGRISQINFIRYGGPRATGCVKAKIYVIAAHAIETPRLLLMSKNGGRTPNGVANTSDMVGRNLMDHPYYVVWGLTRTPIYPYRGPLITSGIGDLCDGPFRNKRAAFRGDIGNEGWNFIVGGVGGDPNVTTLDFVNGLNNSRLNPRPDRRGSPLGKDALFGKALADKLNEKLTRQFRIGFLVEQTPDLDNRVTLSREFKDGLGLDRPEISYNLSDYTRQGFVAAYRLKNLLFEKMYVDEFTEKVGPDEPTRFDELIDGKIVSFRYYGAGHIMGTCRMGDDPKTSVVDKFQRSHDHKNLYVVGSSTFPTGATANPTLTLAALCLLTAKHMLDTDFRK
jgi:choline dehydrogenase-like flavoprotein